MCKVWLGDGGEGERVCIYVQRAILRWRGENYLKHCTITESIEVCVDSRTAICVQRQNFGKKIDYKRAFDSSEPLTLRDYEIKIRLEKAHRREGSECIM